MDYQTQYINAMLSAIEDVNLKGSHPSVVIAQGAVESSWGRSVLSSAYNNYFGIKVGSSWTGKAVNLQTGEVYNGKEMTESSWFRVYTSIEQCLRDRINIIERYYPAALKASSPQLELEALKAGGYATASNYVPTIMSVIQSNGLEKYDNIQYMKANTTYSICLALGIAIVALSAYKLFKK
jgi:flagellum-specific peptidoglycan hydrolase FlgJ